MFVRGSARDPRRLEAEMTARYALLYADIIEKFCIYFLQFWILGHAGCSRDSDAVADPGD